MFLKLNTVTKKVQLFSVFNRTVAVKDNNDNYELADVSGFLFLFHRI